MSSIVKRCWESIGVRRYWRESLKTKSTIHCSLGNSEIFLAVWIQSHDSFENEPPFEYPLNPLFSNRYRYSENPADCFSELWKNNQLGILLISIEIGL